MAGDVHADEVERSLVVDLPRGDYETNAGLIIAAAGTLTVSGTRLSPCSSPWRSSRAAPPAS